MIIELAVGAGVVLMGALALRRAKRRREAEGTSDPSGARALSAERARDDADAAMERALLGAKKKARENGDGEGREKRDAGKGGEKGAKRRGRKDPKNPKSAESTDDGTHTVRPEGPRGLRVGDVLLYADTELWLAGEVHLDEEGFALSVFSSPGSTRGSHVAQLDAEAREVAFLEVTDEVPEGSVPTSLPIDGLRLKLRRRGHADVRSAGENLPHVTERAEYTILGGPGGKTLLVIDFTGGDRLALHGERVGREMYELLPGAD